MNLDVEDLRRQYSHQPLDESEVASDPIEQFRSWFQEARQVSKLDLPNAMTLATAGNDGRPSARMVLLKWIDEKGFVFFTNYESQKGREIAENKHGALVFWWPSLERQVRVRGVVEKISTDASDRYFASRPRGSQLSAWASRQSRVIDSRETLDKRLQNYADKYDSREVPRPSYWGGYRLRPDQMEFWQGRPDRMHDRVCYEREDAGTWQIRRLAP